MGSFFNPEDIQKYIDQTKKSFEGGFPFDGESIHKQVADSINDFMPDFLQEQMPDRSQSRSNHQVFETHDYVILRMPWKSEQKPKLYMDSHHLYVPRHDNTDIQETITLPAPIKANIARAEIKDHILEVRMMKDGPEPMTEINVDDT
ncbi:hypothetical protein [Tuberibacillus sp. Marseille-P3662]|uniref:hypothetical protein n=1 Tax=Tuberibacillus sp. Marseille-P3662 TaxID=1965358 RepID=UPI000A1CDE22|nr:hypothetical protein [Tuberibacillus sp. Marseille-P3662]